MIGICLCAGILSCHNHNDNHDSHVHEDETAHAHEDETVHAHDGEYPTASFTTWSAKTELFVEFPVLAVGKTSRFAAHFSAMQNFKPIKDGTCRITLGQRSNVDSEAELNSPNSPGIFIPELTPTKAGIFDLTFYISNESISDTILISDIKVYASEDDAIHNYPQESETDDVVFLKEQAWKIDFAVSPVQEENIHTIIHTSGEVLPIESDESSISASTSGIVIFKSGNLIEGQSISKGTTLFEVNNDKVISDNLSEKYTVLKANLDQSKKIFEDSKNLVDKGIISQKEYGLRKQQYEIDLAGFTTLTKNYSAGGMTLKAPINGILKKLNVVNGQYVTEGQSIATISSNKQLIVEAEVSQQYFNEIPKIVSANMKLPWSDEIVSIEDYNGKIITKAITTQDHYIPVLFKIDNNRNILPGAFVDIYLKTDNATLGLVIPREAMLREYDMYYVYVMTAGEAYEKRNITIGIDDGNKVQVLSGLEEDEMVVTKGVYAIKMASISSTIPAHGHAH
jgi:membrane fusion protein, heavy metal efflux system